MRRSALRKHGKSAFSLEFRSEEIKDPSQVGSAEHFHVDDDGVLPGGRFQPQDKPVRWTKLLVCVDLDSCTLDFTQLQRPCAAP